MPAIAELSTFKGLPAVRLSAPDGATATVLMHGAHVVSWRPAGGEEQLFLSEQSAYGAGQAVRGGVPVIFPQFAARGPLPRHGFARTRAWQLVEADTGTEDALAVLRLQDDDSTRALWQHGFEVELTARVGGSRLDLELAVTNTGSLPFGFSAALHTYLSVRDLPSLRLEGLQGLTYTDSAEGGTQHTEAHAELAIAGEIDRIYHRATQPLTLREPGRRVHLSSEGFADVVVWNPGPTKGAALADMPPEAWRQMLCVEAGAIESPVRLGPAEGWVGRQSLVCVQ